jgi:hypothetical protein
MKASVGPSGRRDGRGVSHTSGLRPDARQEVIIAAINTIVPAAWRRITHF